jgi:hypothetical protein
MMEKDMSTHDKNGNPWAKLSELKAGDVVQLDESFDCAQGHVALYQSAEGLYFDCSHGAHYLAGQADDGEYCVGVYGPIVP